VAERRDATFLDRRQQPTEPTPSGFVEKDTLDRRGVAELERLLESRLLDLLRS
jgi:hypothetical protein